MHVGTNEPAPYTTDRLGQRKKTEYRLVEEGSGASVVVSPTTPTPGDDNPVFAIPRTGEWLKTQFNSGLCARMCVCWRKVKVLHKSWINYT